MKIVIILFLNNFASKPFPRLTDCFFFNLKNRVTHWSLLHYMQLDDCYTQKPPLGWIHE
jgi:hypothetical protein